MMTDAAPHSPFHPPPHPDVDERDRAGGPMYFAHEAIAAMTEAARPSAPLGRIDGAHRRTFDAAGHASNRSGACGYSVGATSRTSWMDVPPMLHSGNEMPAQGVMVLSPRAICRNSDAGIATSMGHTIVPTETGIEVLSALRLDPVVA